MFDRLDSRSPIPLYEQIASRIRLGVAAGELASGQLLPSVRQLAADLRVNPATVVQAYRGLEAEGLVERKHGSGTFVRGVSGERRADEMKRQAEGLVHGMLAEAARRGVSDVELRSAMERALARGEGGFE